MKFVCDNCKAKYQIGDDKVAGKTLRMKCRRCGELIQVAAMVSETSVSTRFPVDSMTAAGVEPFPGPSRISGEDTDDGGATVVRSNPLQLMEAARMAAPTRPAAGRPAPAAPRPSGARIVPPARASIRSTPPPAAAAPAGYLGGGMHSSSSPALDTGFARAFADRAPASTSQQIPTEDWYVGIGGVPLGPVRLAIIRDKAAAGQVDQDSLVWREGFDEWQPVRSFPALLSLVEEARNVRASRQNAPAITPASATAALASRSSVPHSPPRDSFSNRVPDPVDSVPFDLARSAFQGGSAAVQPGAAAPAPSYGAAGTQQSPFDSTGDRAVLPAPDPFAIGANLPIVGGPAAAGGSPGGGLFGAAAPNGYGLTTTSAGALSNQGPVAPVPPATASVPPPSRKRGVHPMAWATVAMAAAFGGVAAWKFLLRDTRPEIVYIDRTAPAAPGLEAAPPPPPTSVAAGSDPTAAPEASTLAVVGGGPAKWVPGTAGSVKKVDPAAPIDTSGFGSGVSGPTATGPDASGGGGGQLTEGEINGVVSRNKPGITRRCWNPAYESRSQNASKSAKVSASVKVGPSGSVQSVTASGGGADYPSLASCVQGNIRSWQFPPSDGGASVNIPFFFSGQ